MVSFDYNFNLMKSQWSFSFMVNFCVLLKKHMPVSKRHTVLEQKSHFLIAGLVISSLYHGENLPTGVQCSLSRPTQMHLTCRFFFRDPWNTVIAESTFQSLVSRRLGVVPCSWAFLPWEEFQPRCLACECLRPFLPARGAFSMAGAQRWPLGSLHFQSCSPWSGQFHQTCCNT